MSYPPGQLLEDTRVVKDASTPGRYLATITPHWNILYAFGGVTMAAAVSAARAALSQPSFELLTTSCTFLTPVQAGPVTLDVRTLRAGKGSEQLAVDLYQGGTEPALHLVASFGPRRDEHGGGFVDLRCPEVPQPEDTHP